MGDNIFISYAIEDKEIGDAICEMLEGYGWRCWIAPRDILPGSDWGEAIIDAINQSRLMILIYSDNASRSVQIKREVERASSKGVTIVPFRIEDVPVTKSLEFYLSAAYWIDALSIPLAPHLRFLREMVDRLLGMPKAEDAASPVVCAVCGGAISPGERKCVACGHVSRLLPETEQAFGRHRAPRRRWRFWPRSRKAKILTVVVGIVLLSLAMYLGVRWIVGQDSFEAHLNQAMSYGNSGEFDRAIEELNKAVAAEPSNWLGYRQRGGAYYSRGFFRGISGDYSQAANDLNSAIKLNPNDDVAHQLLGQTHIMVQAFDTAHADFTASLKLNPNNIISLKGRAYVLQQKQKYDLAIDDLGQALKLSPNDVQVLVSLGDVCQLKGKYAWAVEWFSRAIALVPGDPNLLLRRSEAYAGLGKLAEAKADKLEAQKRTPASR